MLRPTRLVLSSFLALIAAAAFAQTAPPTSPPTGAQGSTADALTQAQKAEILTAIGDIIDRRMYVTGIDFKKWPEHLSKHREAIDKAESGRAFVTEVNRAFREFGFSHLRLRSPQAATQRRDGPVATGFGLQVEKVDNGLAVRGVTPESPAAKAGIEIGDVIVELDGKAPESPAVLSGEGASKSRIKVLKKQGATIEVELQRSQFSTARKETLKWVDEQTAVLRVFTFSRGYGRENIEELVKEANDKNAKNLILDLRSNGGGATDNLRHLLSLLLPPDTVIGTFVTKREAQAFAEKNNGKADDPVKIAEGMTRKYKTSVQKVPAFKGKIAVLVNRGSASASEICAAALSENSNAPLVGSRTAGAVLASIYGRLPYGYEVQFPINDYITAKGKRLEGNPLMPTIEASVVPSQEKDEALEKAVAALKAGS